MKRTYFSPILWLLIAISVTSCSGTRQPRSNESHPFQHNETNDGLSGDWLQETEPQPHLTASYRASRTLLTDLVHTKLEVAFDWNKAWLIGKETLTAKPHFYPADSLVLDAKGMEINAVTMNGKPLTFNYADDVLTIRLDKTYTRSEQYTVVIDYIAKPDERTTGGSEAITSDKGLYFINPRGEDPTKMPQIWTQGETESSSVWFPTIDAPNVKTTQEMFITVDNKYLTLSNGKLVDAQQHADGTRTDHWKQELPHAPYLFMMGVGQFKVVKDSYKKADGTLLEVSYYVEPEWEPYARDIFGETPEMIAFFSRLLDVEYPWDKYSQIIVRDYVSGAMENTGAVVFGDYAYKTTRELLDGNDNSTIAHELFHHWFGDLVTAESWANLTLNESFANYSQYLWDEYRYGLDEADYNANSEMQIYFQTAMMGGYHDLVWSDHPDKEAMFDAHSYNKGGRILHMLRNYLGDEAFFAGMQLYLKTNRYKAAEFHQLRLAFEEVSGEDLRWFFDQWYESSGHPKLTVTHREENGHVVIDVRQTQDIGEFPVFRLPLEITVFDENGPVTHRAVIDSDRKTIQFPVAGAVKNVWFDSQAMLLAEITETKPSAWYVHQYYTTSRWRSRQEALVKGTLERSAAADQLIIDALSDPFWDIRTTAVDKAVLLTGEAQQQALAKMQTMVHNDSSSAVRANLVNTLPALLTATETKALLERVIRTDQSYLVLAAALNQLSTVDVAKAMQLAVDLEKEASSGMVNSIAALYARNGKTEHYAFYERNLLKGKLRGFDQVGVASAFAFYISRQELPLQQRSTAIFSHLAANGDLYTKMYMNDFIGFLTTKLTENTEALKQEEEKQKRAGNTNAAEIARAAISDTRALITTLNHIAESVITPE